MPVTVEAAMRYTIDALRVVQEQIESAEIKSNSRVHLVFGYVVVALEHQDAIAKLVGHNLIGSALALLRSQVETVFRALWVNLIADDEQVAAIRTRGAQPFPPFREMAVEMDNRYKTSGWLLRVADRWGAMNGYTHTGLEQLWRRFRDDGTIAPNYPDEIIAELLTLSTDASICLVVAVLGTAGLRDQAEALNQWMTSVA